MTDGILGPSGRESGRGDKDKKGFYGVWQIRILSYRQFLQTLAYFQEKFFMDPEAGYDFAYHLEDHLQRPLE